MSVTGRSLVVISFYDCIANPKRKWNTSVTQRLRVVFMKVQLLYEGQNGPKQFLRFFQEEYKRVRATEETRAQLNRSEANAPACKRSMSRLILAIEQEEP